MFKRGWRLEVVCVVAAFTAMLSASAASGAQTLAFSSSFGRADVGEPWLDGSRKGGWRSVYNGYGVNKVVNEEGTNMLFQAPLPSTRADETHASLITTEASFGDIDLRVRTKTVRHLRLPEPNPWEVSWVLWNYTDDLHFYYLILKPNGWELGKEDPAYPGAQRFLATGSDKQFPIGEWYRIRILQVGNEITAWANGEKLVTFVDEERPYAEGRVGLYNEDAEVRFDNVKVYRPASG